jgi:hypothetical protein
VGLGLGLGIEWVADGGWLRWRRRRGKEKDENKGRHGAESSLGLVEKCLDRVAQRDLYFAAKGHVVGIRLMLDDIGETQQASIEVCAQGFQHQELRVELVNFHRPQCLKTGGGKHASFVRSSPK